MDGQSPRKLASAAAGRDERSPLVSQSVLGRYKLISMVATGGMAQVWVAERQDALGLSRLVAIKVIRPELADDPGYARMFVDEATIASAVRHPNVCETYELAKHGSTLFMAMELIPGESFAGILRQGSKIAPMEATMVARICADAALGLHAAHELRDLKGNLLQVVHRDVSPSNILLSVHGQIKVTDFGIAKARHQLHERTRTGEIKGKFGYVAPEQIRPSGPIDRRADVHALGAVLYTGTLGLRPYGNGIEAIPNILEGNFKKPRELRADFPRELEKIILCAMETRPENRFESAEEFREQLESWLWREGTSITQTDIADVVRRRMPEEAYRTAQRHLMGGRATPEDVYRRLLESQSEIDFDTAVTGSESRIPVISLENSAGTRSPQSVTTKTEPPASSISGLPASSPTLVLPTVARPPIDVPGGLMRANPLLELDEPGDSTGIRNGANGLREADGSPPLPAARATRGVEPKTTLSVDTNTKKSVLVVLLLLVLGAFLATWIAR